MGEGTRVGGTAVLVGTAVAVATMVGVGVAVRCGGSTAAVIVGERGASTSGVALAGGGTAVAASGCQGRAVGDAARIPSPGRVSRGAVGRAVGGAVPGELAVPALLPAPSSLTGVLSAAAGWRAGAGVGGVRWNVGRGVGVGVAWLRSRTSTSGVARGVGGSDL